MQALPTFEVGAFRLFDIFYGPCFRLAVVDLRNRVNADVVVSLGALDPGVILLLLAGFAVALGESFLARSTNEGTDHS